MHDGNERLAQDVTTLGAMAGQMADTLNTQSWLYQYIGAERQTKIWFKNPKRLWDNHKRAQEQKKQLKKTSLQEQMLESMGIYRKRDGTYRLTKAELVKLGVDERHHQTLMDMTDPSKNKADASSG